MINKPLFDNDEERKFDTTVVKSNRDSPRNVGLKKFNYERPNEERPNEWNSNGENENPGNWNEGNSNEENNNEEHEEPEETTTEKAELTTSGEGQKPPSNKPVVPKTISNIIFSSVNHFW